MKNIYFPAANGIRALCGESSVLCYVNNQGKKKIEYQNNKIIFKNIIFLRGVVYFLLGFIHFYSFFLGVFIDENLDKNKINRTKNFIKSNNWVWIVLALFLAVVCSVLIFGYIPARLSFLFLNLSSSVLLRNFVIALIKVVFLFLILLGLRFLPALQEIFAFNTACNTIEKNCGQVKNDTKKIFHLATNFLNFVVFSFLLSTFVITLIGINVSIFANWLINLLFFVFILSLSFEFLNLISKSERLNKACVITSFLVCVRPNTTHDEIARLVYIETNYKKSGEKMEEGKISRVLLENEMQTILANANKFEKSDADWIIATILKKNRQEAKLVRFFDEKTYKEIIKATKERALGKPLSAIFGFVEFFGLNFVVNKKVLTPRMETEILVEKVLFEIEKIKKAEVLDLCTGSGAIAVAIAKNCDAKLTAVDISKMALEVATLNAKQNDVKVLLLQSDMFKGLKKSKKFDIIVSNPPYIRTLDIEGLEEEVKNFDPKLSLDGGDEGLDFYKEIASNAGKFLKKGGYLFLEIGKGQFSSVKKMLAENAFEEIVGIKDYNKIYRVVKAKNGRS